MTALPAPVEQDALRTRRPCPRCNGTGWLEPLGPYSDGSYITSRPCPSCNGDGFDRDVIADPLEREDEQ